MEDSRSSSSRRSRMEVEIDIMQAISDGAGRPTHIMYRSNLSWSVMQSFIRSMESQGLLVMRLAEGRKSYALTEKGQRVLETYHSVKKQLDIVAPMVASAIS
ncbi:MAG TPA: winged helix-turn-helix domain-containing protein [Nitrososphaerales archaeon]|nr:winged helix-turn-helix domain-containing protein [Nitrososphaerales archaeon]